MSEQSIEAMQAARIARKERRIAQYIQLMEANPKTTLLEAALALDVSPSTIAHYRRELREQGYAVPNSHTKPRQH